MEEGTTLTAGQPLLRLTNPDLQLEMVNRETAVYELMNNLRNTRNQLLQNRILRQNQLADIDFQLAEARRVFDTNQVLYDQKVIARQDYLQSQNAYRYQLRRRQREVGERRHDGEERRLERRRRALRDPGEHRDHRDLTERRRATPGRWR